MEVESRREPLLPNFIKSVKERKYKVALSKSMRNMRIYNNFVDAKNVTINKFARLK